MLKSWKVWAAAVILVLAVGSRPLLAADQTAYALVDKLAQFFDTTAKSATINADDIDRSLNDLYAQANTAKWGHQIDDQFYNRYTRMLRIFKLATSTEDQSEVLHPLAQQEYVAFVKDVTGKKIDGEVEMPVLAQAITQELESMKKSLDQKK